MPVRNAYIEGVTSGSSVGRRNLWAALLFAGALMSSGIPALAQGRAGSAPVTIGITERLGSMAALDEPFTAEDGGTVTLRQLVTAPTILALVYYNCPNVCDYLLTGVAGVLQSMTADAGKGYNVVSISIDEHETPADARRARRIGLESIEAPFPPQAWRFLTGSLASIRAVTDSVGFHYERRGNYLDHPVGLVILSSQGRIVRYMYGADFLPADLKMALLEASQGRIGPTIAKVLRVCFSYDPASHSLVFNTLKVVATVTLTFAAGFVLFLVLRSRKKRA